jgi:hypothetical protein
MKFNFFENTGKAIKKTAIGAGIITASLSSTEAKGQDTNKLSNIDTTEINKGQDPLKMDGESYRKNYIKYMEHPSYKQRLAKEMFGDSIITKEKQDLLDAEYQRRRKQIEDVGIKMIPDNDELDKSYYATFVTATPSAAYHELSHSVDTEAGGNENGFTQNKIIEKLRNKYKEFHQGKEFEEYKQNYLKFSQILKNYIVEHKNNITFDIPDDLRKEKSAYDYLLNYLDDNSAIIWNKLPSRLLNYFSTNDREKIYKDNNELINQISSFITRDNDLRYYSKPTEIKARLNSLRFRAINDYGFDLNNKLDINNFQELKKDKQYLELKEKCGLSDDQINELFDTVAINNKPETYYPPVSVWGENGKDNLA